LGILFPVVSTAVKPSVQTSLFFQQTRSGVNCFLKKKNNNFKTTQNTPVKTTIAFVKKKKKKSTSASPHIFFLNARCN
jgi:hypothetical protein